MEFTRTTLEIENSLKFFKIKKLCNGPLFYPESQNYEKNQLLDGIKLLREKNPIEKNPHLIPLI